MKRKYRGISGAREKRKSWAQIARDMNYSREAAAYHERKALDKIIRAKPSLPSAPAPSK